MDEVSSYVRLDLPLLDGKAAQKIVPPRLRIPWWKGLGADSEEKRDPASDINTRVVESLKVLDPNRPIREADMPPSSRRLIHSTLTPLALIGTAHFAISLLTYSLRYSGVASSSETTSAPSSVSLSRTAGVCIAVSAASWSA